MSGAKLIASFKWFSIDLNLDLERRVCLSQRYKYRVLQTIQMKLILFFVWADQVVLGSAKTGLKLKYEIQIG